MPVDQKVLFTARRFTTSLGSLAMSLLTNKYGAGPFSFIVGQAVLGGVIITLDPNNLNSFVVNSPNTNAEEVMRNVGLNMGKLAVHSGVSLVGFKACVAAAAYCIPGGPWSSGLCCVVIGSATVAGLTGTFNLLENSSKNFTKM